MVILHDMRITLFTFIYLIGLTATSQFLKSGDIAPDFQLMSIDGEEIQLSDYRGQLVLLDFWAGWCNPCIKSIKQVLVPLREKYDENDLIIIGVNYDRSKEAWEKSIDRFDAPWVHIYDYDNADLYKKYYVQSIPKYCLIDKKGEIYECDIPSSRLEKLVDKYLLE